MVVKVNSALAGIPMPMRKTPFWSSIDEAACRALKVEILALGEFVPSVGAKSGSRPWVAFITAETWAGVIDQPSDWMWQVAQVRPLVPRFWKKAPVVTMLPVVLKVSTCPVASVDDCGFVPLVPVAVAVLVGVAVKPLVPAAVAVGVLVGLPVPWLVRVAAPIGPARLVL